MMCAAVLLGGYLLGSIPWALIIGWLNRIDIRQHGSGNIGATNVRRVLGKKWGILCFVLDCAKGLAPVVAAVVLVHRRPEVWPGWLPAAMAGAAVAGHVWPVWLRFKGGKGVATTIGALAALAPIAVLVAVLGWLAVFYSTRYVSLASVVAAVLFPVSAGVQRAVTGGSPNTATLALLVLLATTIVVRHRTNIRKLLDGTEHKFEKKNTDAAAVAAAGEKAEGAEKP
ncbi:MAG: acyl-phosphate glycerol 3-phosphate acyltransferase [Lentisphaerae bacterium RIFOXYB12_FULL_65_16]|nr:MAG: acyl-phosphate glycerol 3-phosphate acyltransferase [Lentisphaerae bacterium RIFOXYA12_64_32]OGV87525.1 MAG: acyl-phosphate glycerol 3-phosphate acyltransferase [Lentisphaerae bacterium RIFOXYB12_FULL_65_16]